MDNNAVLESRKVCDISGEFEVPSYQRGYRWTNVEITRLLDDIYDNGGEPYCLQPIVVRKKAASEATHAPVYELIDGQQRLTTLYLIQRFIYQGKGSQAAYKPKFSLSYDTRADSKNYLEELEMRCYNDEYEFIGNKDEPDIREALIEKLTKKAYAQQEEAENGSDADYAFIYDAGVEIFNWYDAKHNPGVLDTLYRRLFDINECSVSIIWYEIDDMDTLAANKMFSRLNVGRIALTNAELVKAMFMCKRAGGVAALRQDEIALQWDEMERNLQDDRFWYFLTNSERTDRQTRIDLILELALFVNDLIPEGQETDGDEYYLFISLDNYRRERIGHGESNDEALTCIWREICSIYADLKGWYDDRCRDNGVNPNMNPIQDGELYHKIGYLVASGEDTLKRLLKVWRQGGMTKSEFVRELDRHIKHSIEKKKASPDLDEISYENDSNLAMKILLLFNIVSVWKMGQCFSFQEYKRAGKGAWSLEHIHPQHAEYRNNAALRQVWLQDNLPAVEALQGADYSDLIADITKALSMKKEQLDEDYFEELASRVLMATSEDPDSEFDDDEYENALSNLALIKKDNNSSLSNSAFAIKRRKIIEMDDAGEFIPYCTKMVFLKFYSKSEKTNLDCWGQADRKAYLDKMKETLSIYLS